MTQTSLDVSAYQSLDEIDHVLHRPNMFIGVMQKLPRPNRCYLSTEDKIVEKTVQHSEAQEQIFLEALGNAADNVVRSREHGIDPIQIEVQMNAEWVTVRNYGLNIPVENNEEGLPIPYKIFGQLRTSSNYDDSQKRYTIGTNGYGIKVTNIMSKTFMIECGDPSRNRLYKQTWKNNMKQYDPPEIIQYGEIGYTQISYSPDFARFGATQFDDEAIEIYRAHCAEIAFTCGIPVIFNGTKIELSSIIDYASLFFPITKKSAISYQDPNGQYQLCIVDTPESATCVSFVNGVVTNRGGVHVDAAYKVVVESILKFLGGVVKGIRITKRDILPHVSLFISCRVDKPQWQSQSKDFLKSPKIHVELPDNLLNNIRHWQLIKVMYEDIQRKQLNRLKKTDGKKRKRVHLPNLEEANLAATSQAVQTTLILTEGQSAAAYPTKFISQVPNNQGRDYFGILPLHGKVLNVLNAEFIQILENRDLQNIKQTLGLQEETDYLQEANFKRLRYGHLLVMPDSDEDGKHILGLILVYFMERFFSLVERGFIKFLRTPVARVNYGGQRFLFYTMSAFRRWVSTLPPGTQIPHNQIDYFKGLGSSEDHHIQEDFANPKIVTFQVDEQAKDRILLAFHKAGAQQRKQWLEEWVNQEVLEVENFTELPISMFIDHELIHFSMENVIRSIPEAMDGLKESQRKALFAAFNRLRGNRKRDKMKVAQIANHAAEITNYKHGENSLADAIVKMTYSFVGSNNLPYFVPRGQFGTRNRGGDDAANARYTHISLPNWMDKMYRKEDSKLEKRIVDEGEPQECENFFPVLPPHVINGVIGIGTAYSTNIPAHNPLDVALWFQQRLLQDLEPENNHSLPLLRPWYKGFTGEILLTPNGFITEGKMELRPNGNVVITELPVGRWTHEYQETLDKWEEEGIISGYDNRSTDCTVQFIIHSYLDGAPTLRKLKLIRKHSYNNMTVLYRIENRGIRPRIYNNLKDLLNDFYRMRLEKYRERKELTLSEIQSEIETLSERARFVLTVVNEELIIYNRPEAQIYAQMDQMGFNRKLLDQVKSREYTHEGVAALNRKIETKTQERETLESTRSEQIWHQEIEDFIVDYCRREKASRSTLESCNSDIILTVEAPTERRRRKKKDSNPDLSDSSVDVSVDVSIDSSVDSSIDSSVDSSIDSSQNTPTIELVFE